MEQPQCQRIAHVSSPLNKVLADFRQDQTKANSPRAICFFDSRAAALAWYNDPDYQAASAHRRASSKGRMLLQEGRDETSAPDPKV